MKLTAKQQLVLTTLTTVCREQIFRYSESSPFLFQGGLKRLCAGDALCAWGLGGLTWWVGGRLGLSAGSVLSTFKRLESYGLIVRETRERSYQRPLYWWPVGLANEICAELAENGI